MAHNRGVETQTRLRKSGTVLGYESCEAVVCLDELQQIPAVFSARFSIDRLHSRDEGPVLFGSKLDDLAACGLDGPPRVLLFVDVKIALEGDRVSRCALYCVPQIVGPAVERAFMYEDRPRDVEVIRERVKAMEFVHPVGDRVRQGILLRVD